MTPEDLPDPRSSALPGGAPRHTVLVAAMLNASGTEQLYTRDVNYHAAVDSLASMLPAMLLGLARVSEGIATRMAAQARAAADSARPGVLSAEDVARIVGNPWATPPSDDPPPTP